MQFGILLGVIATALTQCKLERSYTQKLNIRHLPLHGLTSDPLAGVIEAVRKICNENQGDLHHYVIGRESRGLDTPERLATAQIASAAELSRSGDVQRGVETHRHALPRLAPPGLGIDRHMAWVLRTHRPFDVDTPLADDLSDAVRVHAKHTFNLFRTQEKWDN